MLKLFFKKIKKRKKKKRKEKERKKEKKKKKKESALPSLGFPTLEELQPRFSGVTQWLFQRPSRTNLRLS